MEKIRIFLLGLPRRQKRLLQVVTDCALVWVALWLSYVVRLGIDEMYNPITSHLWLFVAAPIIAIPLFVRFGMYRAVMRYFGNDALVAIIKAVSLSTLMLAGCAYLYGSHVPAVPRSLMFNYWWLSLVLIGGLRLMMRQYFIGSWKDAVPRGFRTPPESGQVKVAVYGAGVAGNQLVAALRMGRAMRPVAFIDDDSGIATRVIAGLPVFKPKHLQRMIETTGAEELLLALPSTTRARRREILEHLQGYPLHVRSVPAFADLATGKVKVDDIQEVDIADLLGRDPVPAQGDLLARCITGKAVMVTGAGGSIGSELCRQILMLNPVELILFEHSEFNLYSIHSELENVIVAQGLSVKVVPILGSVRDAQKLGQIMQQWRVHTVYHAAAYKHVPLVEHNIAEGVLNNLVGTLNAAQMALKTGVPNFVLISTDKAVRPTNVMGSTKRLAEMVLQALSKEAAPVLYGESGEVPQLNKTRFTMVRFGNVLGSSGSVIPLFHKQLQQGGPLTVTHPNITRYFMTIPEAAQLVIQAGSMGEGGDVFVLDMGQPVKIVELAEKMIHLSGLSVRSVQNPLGDVAIEFSGLRPGEKLYEELLIGDDVSKTRHPMIMSAQEDHLAWGVLCGRMDQLLAAVRGDDYNSVRQLLREIVNGYAPDGEIVDLLYQQRRLKP